MKIIRQDDIKIDRKFAEEVRKHCGENVFLCYQCRKCASGCPNRKFMDSTPTELIRYVQLGMVDEAMKKNSIWFCVSCQTCSARCPQDIDIAGVIDAIRIISQEKNIKTQGGSTRLFNRIWMTMLTCTTTMYEVGLTGIFNLLRGNPFKDMSLGIKMILKGKLKLIPTFKKPFEMMKMFSRAKKLKK